MIKFGGAAPFFLFTGPCSSGSSSLSPPVLAGGLVLEENASFCVEEPSWTFGQPQ